MGRYYNGDIDGKFWFAVQSSSDADFFGVEGNEPTELEYCFEEDNLPDVKKGVEKCIKALGKSKAKLDKFFEEVDSYTDQQLATTLKITVEETKRHLEWYARLKLGNKILKCLEEQGSCYFTAEC